MRTTVDFLDAVKARHALPSDYSLAPVLGITRAEVSRLRNRKSALGDSTALQVAKLLDIDPAQVIASAHAERAKHPEEKAVWQSITERLAGLAVCVLIGVALFSTAPSEASFLTLENTALMIMSNAAAHPVFTLVLLAGPVLPLFCFSMPKDQFMP